MTEIPDLPARAAPALTKLLCYRIAPDAPRMIAGQSDRAWMDETNRRSAYRCLPLTIASSMGWELLCPFAFEAEWNGGPELSDLVVFQAEEMASRSIVHSHFGHGLLTMHPQYLFRTEPGIGLWVRGAPNRPKDGIAPLDGVIETDWLDFPFTMNWMFTRPGRVAFEKDEPFCFLTPIPYRGLEAVTPEIIPLEADAARKAAFDEYGARRHDFNEKLRTGDPEAVKQGWQKFYMRGQCPSGKKGNPAHLSKLRLADPNSCEEKTVHDSDSTAD